MSLVRGIGPAVRPENGFLRWAIVRVVAEHGAATGPPRSYASRDLVPDEPIELRRNLDALRRARVFMLALVVGVTAVAVAVSLLVPKTYRATATLVLQETLNPFGSSDVETVVRRLETIERLLRTNAVLEQAAERVPGESRESLESNVTSSVDPDANIIRIAALDRTPEGAAAIANAVAETFLGEQAEAERQRLSDARTSLEAELARLQATGGSAAEIAAITEQITELGVREVGAGSELQLAQAAEPPDDSFKPRPVRNGVLAFFASAFLAVLIALGRDRLVPRVSDARELSRLTNLPVLAGVPYMRGRLGRPPRLLQMISNEAHQTLQTAIRFELPPDRQRVILVTSAVEGEGKSHVAAGLARALAHAEQKTLLVSADLRFPTLHDLFGTSRSPGLSELLRAGTNGASESSRMEDFQASVKKRLDGGLGNLDFLPSGSKTPNPSSLLFGDAVDRFFASVAKLDYSYVIVDGAPLIGISDSHTLARRADGVLIVSRLESITLDHVIELRDVLDRLGGRTLGLVVVGTRRIGSYAYAGSDLSAAEDVDPIRSASNRRR